MNYYLLAFLLGAAGLLVMALSGVGRHGGDAHGHDVGHGSIHAAPGSAHAAVHAALPGGGDGHVLGAVRGAGRGAGRAHSHARGGARGAGRGAAARDLLLALASPRVLFSVLLGVGATGLLLGRALGGPALAVVALAGGVLLERLAVAPVWRGVERFASAPARTLDAALYDEARAASGFDANGEGLVALELDGQVVQLLGRLRAEERGLRVRAGDRLRIEDVDPARNRCTVSAAGARPLPHPPSA